LRLPAQGEAAGESTHPGKICRQILKKGPKWDGFATLNVDNIGDSYL
jgi:hypothetical protein